jgi:hypothetical protein
MQKPGEGNSGQHQKPDWSRSGLGLTAAFIIVAGCVSTPPSVEVVHESSRGSVYLEEIPDRSFHAAHPITLEPAIITQVLRGVLVEDQQRLFQTLLAGEPKAVRVLSDEDIAFLTPLMATAFSKATFDQRVRFRVIHRTASGPESTEGTLLVYGRSFHLTLTHYRYNSMRLDPDSKPGRSLPDPTGFSGRHVLFMPEAALRTGVYQPPALPDESSLTTLVIDYELLNKLLSAHQEPASAAPSQPEKAAATGRPTQSNAQAGSGLTRSREPEAPASEELNAIKDLVIKKDMELEALKEELRTLRRKLAEMEAALRDLKGKQRVPARSKK